MNSRVRTALASAAPTIAVDDVRGFQYVFVNGVQTPVGGANSLAVTVGANPYTLIGVAVDASNATSSPAGISGTLTFSNSVLASDATLGSSVIATNASSIQRPNGRTNTSQLVAGDTLTMASLLNAVATLRQNAVPEIDGVFNCYLDPVSARQLFADNDFRQLFVGATSANQVFKRGMINDFLGLRFIPTTEAYVQGVPGGAFIRRPIVCGAGALIEGDFAGMAAAEAGSDGFYF